MRQRRSALTATLVLASLVFAACSTASTDSPASSGTNASAGAEWGPINWRAAEGTSINVLATAMPVSEVYKTRIKDFEALTGIKVNFTAMNDTDRVKAQLLDFQGKTGQYDVSNIGITNREQFATGGYLEPLDNYLKQGKLFDEKWYNLDDYPKDILAGGRSSAGKQVYLPFTAEYFLLWYRTDIFDQLKLKPPANYDELMTTAESLNKARTDGKITQYAYADRGAPGAGESGWNFFATSNRYGYKTIDFANKVSHFNGPVGEDALADYTTPIVKYAPPGSANWSWPDISKAFSQGQLAMTVAGNASYSTIESPSESKVAGKVGYAVPPMKNGGKDPLWEWGWGINASSGKKDAAWLFVLWATSKPLMDEIAPEYGVPARESAYSEKSYLDAMPNESFVNAQKTMLSSGVDPAPPMLSDNWSEAAELISKQINSVVAKQQDSRQAATKIEASLEKLGYKAGS